RLRPGDGSGADLQGDDPRDRRRLHRSRRARRVHPGAAAIGEPAHVSSRSFSFEEDVMRVRKLFWFALLCGIGAACSATDDPFHNDGDGGDGGGTAGGGGQLPHTLESILVTPLNVIVELDVAATGTQAYTASAQYADGTTEDVSDQVTWSV